MEHADYPHHAGYLYDCEACELGPCECSEQCYDKSCDHTPGMSFMHLAACVSLNCEHPERWEEVA